MLHQFSITVPSIFKERKPLMTPHDKVTLINPTLIENKELLFRQDITDDEIRNKMIFKIMYGIS